jgi:hypothetical protein
MAMIIFVHTGYSIPLDACILEARHSNPDARIVLIGNRKFRNKKILTHARCEFFDVEDFQQNSKTFANIYRHSGENPYKYELFCIQRWFIISEFVESQNWNEPILYLDSDALLFVEVNRVFDRLESGIALSQKISPAFTFIKQKIYLRHFCDFISKSYVDPVEYQKLEDFVLNYSNVGMPHISDMTLFGQSEKIHGPANVIDLREILNESLFFCDNVFFSQGMHTQFYGKKIIRHHGETFFISLDYNKQVLAGGVHLQGIMKPAWMRYSHTSTRGTILRFNTIDFLLQAIWYTKISLYIIRSTNRFTLRRH